MKTISVPLRTDHPYLQNRRQGCTKTVIEAYVFRKMAEFMLHNPTRASFLMEDLKIDPRVICEFCGWKRPQLEVGKIVAKIAADFGLVSVKEDKFGRLFAVTRHHAPQGGWPILKR